MCKIIGFPVRLCVIYIHISLKENVKNHFNCKSTYIIIYRIYLKFQKLYKIISVSMQNLVWSSELKNIVYYIYIVLINLKIVNTYNPSLKNL